MYILYPTIVYIYLAYAQYYTKHVCKKQLVYVLQPVLYMYRYLHLYTVWQPPVRITAHVQYNHSRKYTNHLCMDS